MKNHYIKIITVLCFIFQYDVSSAQTPQVSFELSNEHSGSTWNYQARDFIKLKPGFHYKADPAHHFKGKINDSLTFPVNYITQSTPDDLYNSHTFNPGLVVGAIAGVANVTPTGGASYSIPIEIPPGINGMVPQLSINYNSQGGNNLLGFGWMLSGASSVSRVPNTVYHDYFTKGIGFDSDSRYAIDGNRIIVGNDGKYHTEMETFSNIQINGTYTDPTNFIVTTKEGLIYEYNEKVILSQNGPAIQWLLTKITDPYGNFITFNFEQADGDAWLTSVQYSGGICEIKFIYGTNDIPNCFYNYGYLMKQNRILEKIKVVSENTLFREYSFVYYKTTDDLYPRLTEIKMKGSDGKEVNSTVVNWGVEGSSDTVNTGIVKRDTSQNYFTGDFNGDGKTDVMYIDKQTTEISIYPNNNLQTAYNAGYLSVSGYTYYLNHHTAIDQYNDIQAVDDFNNDGFDDIAVVLKNNNTINEFDVKIYYAQLSSGQVVFSETNTKLISSYNESVQVTTGDFNGDSSPDLLVYYHNFNSSIVSQFTIYLQDHTTGSFDPVNADDIIENNVEYDDVRCADFNGDGRTDVFFIDVSSGQVFFLILSLDIDNNEHYTEFDYLLPENNYDSKNPVYIADFNGDGKTDVLIQTGPFTDNQPVWDFCCHQSNIFPQTYKLLISNGSPADYVNTISENQNLFTESPLLLSFTDKNIIIPADFNGDGKADLLLANWNSWQIGSFELRYLSGDLVNNPVMTSETFSHYFYNCSARDYLLCDLNNDGRPDFLPYGSLWDIVTTAQYATFHSFGQKYLVTGIKDGMDVETRFNYSNLADDGIYSKNTVSSLNHIPDKNNYPVKNVAFPMTVVASMQQSNGIASGMNTTSFHYNDLLVHSTGKGFLGFLGMGITGPKQVTTLTSQLINTSDYCTMELLSQNMNTTDGLSITKSFIYDYDLIGNKGIFKKLLSLTENHPFNGTTTTGYLYDPDGNITTLNTIYDDGTSVKKTFSGFVPVIPVNQVNLPLSLPGSLIEKKTIDNEPFQTTTVFSWDAGGKNYTTSANGVTVTNFYNTNGTLQSTAKTGAGTTSYTYGGNGRFITKVTDAMGYETKMEYYSPFAQLIRITDINNLSTRFDYDGLGRLRSKTLPDGQTVNTTIAWNSGGEGYYTLMQAGGNPYSKNSYDKLGRVTGTETQGFDGSAVTTTTNYFATGEASDYTALNGDITSYTYDGIGRVLTQNTSGMGSTSIAYSPHTVTTNAPDGIFTKVFNSLGLVKTTTDNAGSADYMYFGHGGMNTVTSNGSTITAEYDGNGFQKKLKDPDAGEIEFHYNDMGQLEWQDNPGSIAGTRVLTSFYYDFAGRCTTKIIGNVTYTYEYDTRFKGALTSITSTDNMAVYYSYNHYGDVTQKTETIEGQDYITKYDYDNRHHVTKKTYPSGFAVSYNYSNLGFVKDAKNAADGSAIWDAVSFNKSMQPTEFTMGSNIVVTNAYSHNFLTGTDALVNGTSVHSMGYTWDYGKGNLSNRNNNTANLQEHFTYDAMQRCTTATTTGSATANINTSYDNNGNITAKSDVGDYGYNGLQPHAVTDINNFVAGSFPQTDQNITYNKLNKVATITEDINSMEFVYGVASERRKATFKQNTNDVQWTRYYASEYDKTIFADGHTRELHYISGPSGLVAINVRNSAATEDSMYFVFKDHLGSLTTITDKNGSVLQHLNYNLWGRRSVEAGSVYASPLFDRGFTGHEHLDVFGLINMNGRVYDPLLGRFLSPDNYVQGGGSQAFNRYTYCLNNPLKYTDPTGEFVRYSYFGWQRAQNYFASVSSYGFGGSSFDVPDGQFDPILWHGINSFLNAASPRVTFDYYSSGGAYYSANQYAYKTDENGNWSFENKQTGTVVTASPDFFESAKDAYSKQTMNDMRSSRYSAKAGQLAGSLGNFEGGSGFSAAPQQQGNGFNAESILRGLISQKVGFSITGNELSKLNNGLKTISSFIDNIERVGGGLKVNLNYLGNLTVRAAPNLDIPNGTVFYIRDEVLNGNISAIRLFAPKATLYNQPFGIYINDNSYSRFGNQFFPLIK